MRVIMSVVVNSKKKQRKQVGRVIPHYDKPKMKLTVTPKLAEEMGMKLKAKTPIGQQEMTIVVTNVLNFLTNYLPFLEIDPEIQRLHIQSALEGETNPTKSQGIMECILNGFDIGEIKFREYSDSEKIKFKIDPDLDNEMEDGSGRVRTLDWFLLQEKFKMHPKFKSKIFPYIDFNSLGSFSRKTWPQEVIDYLENYQLVLKIYTNMTEEESSTQFKYTNMNSKANRQQLRNGKGRKSLPKMNRDLVRGKGVLNEVNRPHPLFANRSTKSGNVIFDNFKYNNDTLIMEEQVAQICYRYWVKRITGAGDNYLGVASQDQLDYMYEQNHSDEMIDNLREDIIKHLNFLFKIAKLSDKTQFKFTMGKGLTTKFHLYSRLRFMLLDYTNGKEPKFKDLEKFHNDVKDACIRIDDIKELQPNDEKERTVAAAFKNYFSKHDDIERITTTKDILLQQLNLEHHVKNFDSKRVYSREKLEGKWRERNKKCSELGVEMSFPECQGGHIISDYNEGKVTDENIDPMHRIVNNHMSKMNRDEWRKLNMLDGKIISQSFYDHINRFASDDLKKKLTDAGIWNQSNIK